MLGRVVNYVKSSIDDLYLEIGRYDHSVLLDQCVGVSSLAYRLAQMDLLVIRACSPAAIDDEDIIRVGEEFGSLILTKDRKRHQGRKNGQTNIGHKKTDSRAGKV